MQKFYHIQRPLALILALVLTGSLMASPVLAAEKISPACDETYYATLDYYGSLMESSVVKSYRTFGSSTITDYGVYDAVNNLTDGRTAAVENGKVTFNLTGNVPDRFYFEGKTSRPYEELPWRLSLSYKLNGVPMAAEQLAGKCGVVEITLDVLPNPEASEYSRNNLVLTASSIFNCDDILSLEAPGAQVQMIGNLRCVLFIILPGEEQHFTIRVGTNDFSYTGMVFLAVPATLEQLDQVTDLREAKEKIEDSYHAINKSLDVFLNSLDGMSSNLNQTANGLDQLNRARSTISAGKGEVYDSLDAALEAAGPLTDAMEPMAGHLAAASQALSDTTVLLNEMSSNLAALKPELENARTLLKQLTRESAKAQELLKALEDTPKDAKRIASDLSGDFKTMGKELEELQSSLDVLKKSLSDLHGISNVHDMTVDVNGIPMTLAQIMQYVNTAVQLHDAYVANYHSEPADPAALAAFMAGTGKVNEEQAVLLTQLYYYSLTEEYRQKMEQAETASDVIGGANDKIDEVNQLIGSLIAPSSYIIKDLKKLTDTLGNGGISGDLRRLSELAEKVCKEVDANKGLLGSTLSSLDDMADLAVRVSRNGDTALDQIQSMTQILNTYEPKAQQALADAQTLAQSAAVSLKNLVHAAKAAESLAKSSGSDVDGGIYQAFTGLSNALRRSSVGLGQTDTIRTAKNAITQLIDDEWDSHTGENNNLLLMNAAARPVSLTDVRNEGTAGIQLIMRSQEIKAETEKADEAESSSEPEHSTVWTRIGNMFKDFWHAITGLFK